MMRKRSSSGNSSNPNSVVVFEDPSSKSGSSSEDSNGNGHAIMKNRKRTRPDFVKRQDSQYENSMNEGGSRGFSSRSISSDIYGVMCCKDRCTNRSQSWLYTALIILLGGAACTSVIVLGLQSTKLSSQKLFQNQAAEVVFSLNSSWREYETALLWIHQSCDPRATATDASSSHTHNVSISDHDGFCSRPEFDSLTRHIDSLHLQVVSIQFAPSITHDQRPALEEESAEYYASLSNRTSSNSSVSYPYLGITNVAFDADTGDVFERILAPEESVYFPVHYIHPLSEERNQALIEMDLYGIPEIRDDIDRALRDFQPVMGDRFRIPMEEDDGQDDVLLWAIGIIHPGIDERLMDGHAIPTDGHHHSVSRIELRPADLIQRSISSLDFPEDGGMSVYIFDATVDVEANASSEPIFLAALDRLDDGTLSHLEEINFESVNELEEPYTFQNARIHQGTIDVANHQWTIVVVPTGAAYSPSFDFVVLGSLLVFLATVLVTCLYQRSNARANEMRSLKSEQTREKAKTALLQAQRERHLNDFLAHEVRNPLSSALAALSFIREGVAQIPDDISRQSLSNDVSTVQNSLDYIDDLLRNMLDIHRTSEQDFTLRYSLTNLKNGLLRPVKDIASARNQGKDVNFLVETSSKLWAEVDPLRVEQVLLNLAMDAAKYVDDGGFVRFRADVVDRHVCLYVEDSGPGIPFKNRKRLFERYQESLGIISQGTGVGLHICKTLTNLMGAKIWLDDTYNSGVPGYPGTRFVIDLQRQPMTRCSQSPTGFCDGHCDCWQSTEETTPTKRASSSSMDPIYKDDDVEACPVAGDSASTTADITVDANDHFVSLNDDLLTLEEGHGTSSAADQIKCETPMESPDQFAPDCAVVDAENSQPDEKQEDDEEDYLPESLSVLFVDDDNTLRKLFCRSARRLHHSWNVAEAHNGETALEMVRENHYDLIFMDQYMESTSKQLLGTEVVRAMRDMELVDSSTTICGLSANEEKERFLSAGADYFLLKPIQCSKDALKEQIMRVLRVDSKTMKDDIQVVGTKREEDTADARRVRYQRRRSSC